MKQLMLILGLFISVAASAEKSVPCPDGFIFSLRGLNDYFLYQAQGLRELYRSNLDEFQAKIKKEPRLVNCVDEVGATPLTAALSARETYCTNAESAKYLIEQGANIDQAEGYLDQTPLYYALESYGYIWGKPQINGKAAPELTRDLCRDQTSEVTLRGIIRDLIAKGAKTKRTSMHGTSIRDAARDGGVLEFIQK